MFSANKISVMGVNNYTGTTAASFDVVVTDQNGGAIGSGDDLLFKQKLSDGTYQNLGLVKYGSVKKVTKKLDATAIPAYADVTVTAGAVGDLYRVEIALNNFGSDSFEDQYIKQATHACTTATALSNALGLVSSLYLNWSREAVKESTYFIHPNDGFDAVSTNLDETAEPATAGLMTYSMADNTWYVANAKSTKEWKDIANANVVSAVTSGMTEGLLYIVKATSTTGSLYYATGATTAVKVSDITYHKENPYFTFVTASDGSLYVIEKDQEFVLGKFQSKPLVFTVTGRVYDASDSYSYAALTVSSVGRVQNPLDSYQMAGLEWFCKGYKGDNYREMGYPYNFPQSTLVNTSTSYQAIYTIHYADDGQGFNKGAVVDNVLYILCASDPATASTNADIIEDGIYTAWGIDVRTTDA